MRRRSIASAFVGSMLTGLLVSFAALPAQAQFNGPPGGVQNLEMNRPAVITTDPAILYPPIHTTTLFPGDLLDIKLYGDADYSVEARIDRDGGAEIPLMGHVHLAGLSLSQAEDLISERLVALGMFRDPQVILSLKDGPGQFITFFGETRGLVSATGDRHLLDVLAAVGGIPASVSHILTINRPGLADPIVLDIGTDPMRAIQSNIPLMAGDIIITSRVGQVYVFGDFKTTGIIQLNSYTPLTLLEVVVQQGGVLWQGKKDHLHIIRTIGNRRTVSTFDIKKIMKGTAPDPILQPSDIVYLPDSPLKAIFTNGALNQIISYASLVISIAAFR